MTYYSLSEVDTSTPKRRERAKDMTDAMGLYCSGSAGHFFNRTEKAWSEAGVTIMEMGLSKDISEKVCICC